MNNVYYDKKTNRFCQLRSGFEGGFYCSFAIYYSDAITATNAVPISDEYIKENMVEVVDVSSIGIYDGNGWRIKEVK